MLVPAAVHARAATRQHAIDQAERQAAVIAATLAIPVGTVMSRLHGARKRLREHLHADLASLAT